MKRIVSICGDAGGAAALAPVIARLRRENGCSVDSYAYRQACRIFDLQGLDTISLDEPEGLGEVRRILTDSTPDLVLTATSIGEASLEMQFIAEARRLGIPTLTVLDFWSNYVERFTGAANRALLGFLPDRIAIMDSRAQEEMESLGFPSDCLEITGQPAFDVLQNLRLASTSITRTAIRQTYSIGDSDLLVLYLSSPVSSHRGADESSSGYLGYTEHTSLRLLLDELETLSGELQGSIHLLVKPHPRDPADNFDGWKGNRVRLEVVSQADTRQLILASDLVVGTVSVALIESCLLGRPTISLQPGLKGEDMLPSNRWGATTAVYDARDLQKAIIDLLIDEYAQQSHLGNMPTELTDGRAAERVARVALDMIQHASEQKTDALVSSERRGG
ncbi:MAG: CDP-glycerol glycerophosphotransferase family protein [Chloroflexi bacterium]|nr:CDP-glycerol glycerophosphotransferase family protein [Chloroflexota bacterium]